MRKSEVLNNLPYGREEVAKIFDRGKEIQQIERALFQLKRPIVAVCGEAGVGKTTIVSKVAFQQVESGLHAVEGVVWATAKQRELSVRKRFSVSFYQKRIKHKGIFAATLFDLLYLILEVMESPLTKVFKNVMNREDALFDLQDTVYSLLEGRKVIVVIDDVDSWVLKERRRVFDFVQDVPWPSQVILTSRKEISTFEINGVYTTIISPMPNEVAEEFLDSLARERELKLKTEEKALILRFARGNPLFIKLSIALLSKRGWHQLKGIDALLLQQWDKENVQEYLYQSLLELLSPAHKTLLKEFARSVNEERSLLPMQSLYNLLGSSSPQKIDRYLNEIESTFLASVSKEGHGDYLRIDMHPLTVHYLLSGEGKHLRTSGRQR